MKEKVIYDIIGIGIGPFNLGLAALTSQIPELRSIFFDRSPSFQWHPGLMLSSAKLQVPFIADLVTLVNPSSPFSFLSYLHATGKMLRFGIRENYFPSRRQYNAYCQWVAGRLVNLRFDSECASVMFDSATTVYEVKIRNKLTRGTEIYYCKNLVVGIGMAPSLPEFIQDNKHPNILHSGEYLFRKESLNHCKKILIVGSGQSAAEIFYDLLQSHHGYKSLAWYTRSKGFYPMDYSRFSLEMTSPDYIDHFYGLEQTMKTKILAGQDMLFKGINQSLIDEIYDELCESDFENSNPRAKLHPNCVLEKIETAGDQIVCSFHHTSLDQKFERETDGVILATGYKNAIPEFLHSVKEQINWNTDGNYQLNRDYSVDDHHSLFVQNADLHTHGFNSADLGLGPYRNAAIINTILGKEHFKIEKNIAFQCFGIDE